MKERRKEDKRLGLGVATVGRGISLPVKPGWRAPSPKVPPSDPELQEATTSQFEDTPGMWRQN